MAKVVNLGRARKDRAREEKRKAGDRNAAFHGLTKDQKARARAEAARAARRLDGHARGPDGDGEA